ncbi:MAG: serine racemase VanT catalytic subunit [Clostridiales bacterium]|nr:serine racemase VanT catalytic subunit [Clostridiales bacterium]
MENTTKIFEQKRQEIFRTWAELDLNALQQNVSKIKKILPDSCQIMAVVKANAYGHGDVLISSHLNQMGIYSFAVATLEEAIHLRKFGIEGSILILGYTPSLYAPELMQYDLTQTVADFSHAQELAETKIPIKVEIKIDTGMHRLGITPEHKKEIVSLFSVPTFCICGMYTHLCVADSQEPEDIAFSQKQLESFKCLTDMLKAAGISLPPLHVQSSYGVLNYPSLKYDFARIGILLYGCHSQFEESCLMNPDVRPVLSLYSHVALIREVDEGDTVGYGRTYKARRKRRLAVIPIGYADGYPRSLSNRGYVLIHGQRARIVGRICMDQMIADVTAIENVCVSDRVTLIGKDGRHRIYAEELAALSQTITNELLSRLGSRITRVLLIDKKFE